MMTTPGVARLAWLVCFAGIAIHLPWIATPFGIGEQNPGCYFGTFVQNFDRFGLAATRGLPLGISQLDEILMGMPYQSHPPGLSWLLYLCGTAEWQLRLPTVVAAALAGTLLFSVLSHRFGRWPSAVAALVLMSCPAVAFFAIASYESVVLGLGMVMVWAMLRLRDGPSTSSYVALGIAAFVGPWIEWQFAFHCLALVPLAWDRRVPVTVKRLAVPATCAIVSLGLILWWRAAIAADPTLPPMPELHGMGQLFRDVVLDRPPFAEYVAGVAWTIGKSFSVPVAIAAIPGAVLLARSHPHLAIAFLIMGFGNPLMFPRPCMSHEMNYAGMAPLIGASCCALVRAAPAPRLATVLGIALCALPLIKRTSLVINTRTDFMRDVGAALTEAIGPRAADGKRSPRYITATSVAFYGYYTDANNLVIPYPVRDPATLADGVERVDPADGARYLWLRAGSVSRGVKVNLTDPPGLEEYLAPFPKRRLPELETTLDMTGLGDEVEFTEAWLVTLREPGS